jgi:hypothetical protein
MSLKEDISNGLSPVFPGTRIASTMSHGKNAGKKEKNKKKCKQFWR